MLRDDVASFMQMWWCDCTLGKSKVALSAPRKTFWLSFELNMFNQSVDLLFSRQLCQLWSTAVRTERTCANQIDTHSRVRKKEKRRKRKKGVTKIESASGEDAVVHFYPASQCAIQVILEHRHTIAQHMLRGTAQGGRQHAPTAYICVGK